MYRKKNFTNYFINRFETNMSLVLETIFLVAVQIYCQFWHQSYLYVNQKIYFSKYPISLRNLLAYFILTVNIVMAILVKQRAYSNIVSKTTETASLKEKGISFQSLYIPSKRFHRKDSLSREIQKLRYLEGINNFMQQYYYGNYANNNIMVALQFLS